MGTPRKKAKKAAPTRVPKDAQVVTFCPDVLAQLTLSYGKPHPNWLEFLETYKGRPGVELGVIYALPDLLISAIVKQIPAFFSEEELSFERNLTRLAGAGFFLKRPFGYLRLPHPTLSAHEAAKWKELEKRHTASDQAIRAMLEDEMRKDGRTEEEIRACRYAVLEERNDIEIRQQGYAGWLVSNHEFRQHRDAFRDRWGGVVKKLGGFPQIPLSPMGLEPSPPAEEYVEFYRDFTGLCVTWGLDGFATWELPRPMRPELRRLSVYYLPAIREAGVVTFVPWYLLRDKKIQLDELAEHIRLQNGPEHLRDWLDHKPKGWGHDRFAVMLEIYIFIELCLKSRYPERIKRNTERLDRALGYFLFPRPE